MSATYTKLKSGDWGVRSTSSVREGQTIIVTKKDGTTKQETVKKVVWSGNGVWLCAIAQKEPSYTPQAGSRRSSGNMTGRCWECGGAMPQWLADKGEECGNC